MKRGVKLGADIPFCILRGTALSEGIGEVLTPLSPMPKCHILIAKPDISVSTKFVYENLKLNEDTIHPDIDGMVNLLTEQNLLGISKKLSNVLEQVTITKYPVIHEIKEFMIKHGALNSLMSGSGPTVYGLFEDKELAYQAKKELAKTGLAKDIVVTSCFNMKKK